jgi:hypothetical protein
MESKILHVNPVDFDNLTPDEHEEHHKMAVDKFSRNEHEHDDIWKAISELKARLPTETF